MEFALSGLIDYCAHDYYSGVAFFGRQSEVMKSKQETVTVRRLFAGVVFLCFLGMASGNLMAAELLGVRVYGKVVNSAGYVIIADATVSLVSSNRVYVTTSDAEGDYEFTDVEVGFYQISATKEGFLPQTAELDVDGSKPEFLKNFFLELERSGDLNNDKIISAEDLMVFLKHWYAESPQASYNYLADFNYDRIIDESDLLILLARWHQQTGGN